MRDPRVFLFDEPLSNLDAALRVTTRNELIKQQHEIGITSIYVTHDQVEAMTMGHRICIMDKGEVVQIGRPLEVYRNPANTFVARFLGNPPMNLLPAELEAERWPRCAAGRRRLHRARRDGRLAALGGGVILGIRPEDLYEIAGSARRRRDGARFPVRVVAVEPLGAETLLVLATGDGVRGIDRACRAADSGSSRAIAPTSPSIPRASICSTPRPRAQFRTERV